MDYYKESLKKHEEWAGKLETKIRVPVDTKEDLMLAYTPGVAQPCIEINKNYEKSFTLTRRWNSVAVITDGTAILGLGDIGPEAGMPVMEGKSVLFKAYGEVDATPLCLRTKDVEEIVRTIYLISGSFGGINLEDIAAPRCFEIERRLKEICDIPIFHDDQHGTAIVVGAALTNALKIVGKTFEEIKVVISGAGAAGLSIADFLMKMGVKDIILAGRKGILEENADINYAQKAFAAKSNPRKIKGKLSDALSGADVFIGVSAPGLVSKEMISSMNKDAIVFPLANPVPEITREEALDAGARIVGTGSSKNPNQINNVLVFPGIFRGALDERASDINYDMMVAASKAIALTVGDDELNENYILPAAFDKRVHKAVAKAVACAAKKSGVARI